MVWIRIFFRNPKEIYRAKNQSFELEKMVKLLTDEEFENYDSKYKRRIQNPEKFEVLDIEYPPTRFADDDENEDTETYKCICTDISCKHLQVIRYKPTNICFASSSHCSIRLDEKDAEELYLKFKAKKCKDCKVPLVYKISKYAKKKLKKCDGRCYDCF